jgi:hypothetical protein
MRVYEQCVASLVIGQRAMEDRIFNTVRNPRYKHGSLIRFSRRSILAVPPAPQTIEKRPVKFY